MAKPTLYVELDGPLVVPAAEHADPFLNGALAPYAKPFMRWASQHFDLVCMTDRDMLRARHALRELGMESIPVLGYDNAKIHHIDPKSNFHWVDSALVPSELNWIAEHRVEHRVQTVHPEEGVTEDVKSHLEKVLHKVPTSKGKT